MQRLSENLLTNPIVKIHGSEQHEELTRHLATSGGFPAMQKTKKAIKTRFFPRFISKTRWLKTKDYIPVKMCLIRTRSIALSMSTSTNLAGKSNKQ